MKGCYIKNSKVSILWAFCSGLTLDKLHQQLFEHEIAVVTITPGCYVINILAPLSPSSSLYTRVTAYNRSFHSLSRMYPATQSIFSSRHLQIRLPGIKPTKASFPFPAYHIKSPLGSPLPCSMIWPHVISHLRSHDPLTWALHRRPAVVFSQLPALPGSPPTWLTGIGGHERLEGCSTCLATCCWCINNKPSSAKPANLPSQNPPKWYSPLGALSFPSFKILLFYTTTEQFII